MSEVSLTFQAPDGQISVQIGDIAYYVNLDSPSGGFDIASQSNIVTIGPIIAIQKPTYYGGVLVLTCDMENDVTPPGTSSFILFSKDNTVNCSSLLGYYGSAKFINDSTVKAEMFAASCEINQSSK